jgi:DNA-binding transcriptional ArsR family regulator
MSDPAPSPRPPVISIDKLSRALGVPARWIILRELGRGQALPVVELAKRAGISAPVATRTLMVMRQLGVVEQIYGRLYQLPASFRADPATGLLDLGHCLLRLNPPAPAAPPNSLPS